jgi:hypothetical protein
VPFKTVEAKKQLELYKDGQAICKQQKERQEYDSRSKHLHRRKCSERGIIKTVTAGRRIKVQKTLAAAKEINFHARQIPEVNGDVLKSPYITSGRQNHLFDTMNLKPTCYKTNQ